MLAATGNKNNKRVAVYTMELRGGKQSKEKNIENEDVDEEEIEEKIGNWEGFAIPILAFSDNLEKLEGQSRDRSVKKISSWKIS